MNLITSISGYVGFEDTGWSGFTLELTLQLLLVSRITVALMVTTFPHERTTGIRSERRGDLSDDQTARRKTHI